jgi:N-dimethylarginine dimethylaminohydrolase
MPVSCALVRPPGASYVRAISSTAARIDVALSLAQHAEYCQALTAAGLPVISVPVGDNLHLLSAVAYLGQNRLLAVEAFADRPVFAGLEIIPVPRAEAYAANVLALGDHVIVPAGYPRVAHALRACGVDVLPVPTSEFAKADGGVTCLSLLL